MEELRGAPPQRGEDFAVGCRVSRVGELKEPLICGAEYFRHSVSAWCRVHREETGGDEAICLHERASPAHERFGHGLEYP